MIIGSLYLFYYCSYYFSQVFFTKFCSLSCDCIMRLLNFSFCQYILSHSTRIFSKLALLQGALLFTLSVSLNRFLMVEMQSTYMIRHICKMYLYNSNNLKYIDVKHNFIKNSIFPVSDK